MSPPGLSRNQLLPPPVELSRTRLYLITRDLEDASGKSLRPSASTDTYTTASLQLLHQITPRTLPTASVSVTSPIHWTVLVIYLFPEAGGSGWTDHSLWPDWMSCGGWCPVPQRPGLTRRMAARFTAMRNGTPQGQCAAAVRCSAPPEHGAAALEVLQGRVPPGATLCGVWG